MIPLRMDWSSLDEQVWDFIEDSQFDSTVMDNIYSYEFTQIGVACNCHDIYGEICVVELGANVVGVEHMESVTHNAIRYGSWLDHEHVNENDTMPIPEFLARGDPNC